MIVNMLIVCVAFRVDNEFHQLPVIVSELACTSRDPASVIRFTVELANWLDEQDWVAEYGFFGCMRHRADDFVSPAAQLMDENGDFTPLMRSLVMERPMTSVKEPGGSST